MDYGSHLKATVGNLSRSSRHYAKQSQFEGSRRQIRGQVLRLLAGSGLSRQKLTRQVPDERLLGILDDLEKEGLIVRSGHSYTLAQAID
jgi:A/G-specific adenine glycosylase